MQNKSQNKRAVYRRCAKVSVAELREAMGAPLNAHSATASLARAAPTGGRCARPASSPHYQTISLINNVPKAVIISRYLITRVANNKLIIRLITVLIRLITARVRCLLG